MSVERDSPMSLKSKKPPPLKKRHTKPCKYFQMGRCPHPADSCNFAHVQALPSSIPMSPCSPITPMSPHGVGSIYCAAGQCTGENGYGCRQAHDVNVLTTQMSSLHMNAISPISPTTPFSPEYTYSNPYTYQPYYQAWSPSSYHNQPSPSILSVLPKGNSLISSDSVSTDGTISQLDTPVLGGEEVGLGNTVNVNFDQVREDDEIVTEDPQFVEHPHKHQSQIRVHDTPTAADHLPLPHSHSHSHPVPIPAPIPIHHHHHHHHHPNQAFGHGIGIGHPVPVPLSPPPPWDALHYGSLSPMFNGPPPEFRARSKTPKSRSSSRASSRSKAARFKTKICKFFNTEQGCPSGDNCTFIHDASIPPVPTVTRSSSKSPKPSPKNEVSQESTNPSPKIDHESDVVLQKESKSQTAQRVDGEEDNNNKSKKKNFFPITWRVIGGGVLVGGHKNKHRGMGKGGDDNFEEGDQGVETEVEEPEPSSPEIETGYINKTGGMFGLFGGKKEVTKLDTLPMRPRSMSISRLDKERSDHLFLAAET